MTQRTQENAKVLGAQEGNHLWRKEHSPKLLIRLAKPRLAIKRRHTPGARALQGAGGQPTQRAPTGHPLGTHRSMGRIHLPRWVPHPSADPSPSFKGQLSHSHSFPRFASSAHA